MHGGSHHERLWLNTVDPTSSSDLGFLFGVLLQRLSEPHTNISHTSMPPWDGHCKFVASRPYGLRHWVIRTHRLYKGVCYVSPQKEIGIYVSPQWRREGIGKWAIDQIMLRCSAPLFANVAKANLASFCFFAHNGFVLVDETPIQFVFQWIPHDVSRTEVLSSK